MTFSYGYFEMRDGTSLYRVKVSSKRKYFLMCFKTCQSVGNSSNRLVSLFILNYQVKNGKKTFLAATIIKMMSQLIRVHF